MISKTLVKKKSSGKIRVWRVETTGPEMKIIHGEQGGKQTEKIKVCKPKNIGRANETTAEQQANQEALAAFNKQKDRECYVENLGDPAPYVQPMLALDATKVPHRINWDNQQYGQAKLDGLRGFHDSANEGTVQSRKGTHYKLPHLYEQLEELRVRLGLPKDDSYIDGEIFKMGIPLGKINGASKKPNELTPDLEFHVFDLACRGNVDYAERREVLMDVAPHLAEWGLDKVVIVPSQEMKLADLNPLHNKFVQRGYEGLMIRNGAGMYGFDERSDSLFKYKKFLEQEFLVVDVMEDDFGQAVIRYQSPEGHHPDKPTFDSRPRGTDAYREYVLANKTFYIGLKGTVRYFALTEYGIPQFPVTVILDPDK